ncbi:MAG: PAS domain S-box protein [Desulfocapsaceae bacterium]|nr:PAS domain S-box protein [Desulfocapsaceae bacterium]
MDKTQLSSYPNLDKVTQRLGSNLYLYQILDQSPNGVVIVSLDHRIIHANPAASAFFGSPDNTLTDLGLAELLGPDNRGLLQSIKDFLNNPKRTEASRLRAEIITNPATSYRCVLDTVVAYLPSTPEYYLIYLHDITTKRQLERELRRRNAFFHNLIDSSVDSIIAADMKGTIILFNQGAQALLGYSEKEAVSNLHVTGLYQENVAYELIKRMRSNDFGGQGKLLRHEIIIKHKDGHSIPVSFSGGIIYDKGQEIATFGIFTDMRAILQIEEDLEHTHNMLIQSEKMAGLGRLAAGVAHEINNPMSGIMLYANLVHEELGRDHPLHEDLNTIIREAERCKVIVADLLEFSHQTTYEMELTDPNSVIRKTLGVLKNQPLFQNIQIDLRLDENILPIFGNSMRLNQVIMNILINAAQAMGGHGGLKIISRTRANKDIDEIIIADTGPGIEENLLEKIFDPFFTTKATGEGTGLGLSVSYAIVKEHKGSIRVTSAPESGATFTLRFPAVMHNQIGENHEQ